MIVTEVKVGARRPLGDGLHLVEASVTANGDAAAATRVASWAAVNREAVRLDRLSGSGDPEGRGQWSWRFWVVVA